METGEENVLIERSQRGDKSAFGELASLYLDRAFQTAFGVLGNVEDARDASQDAFIKAYKRLGMFRGESGFFTWFYRILVNTCIDAKRKRRLMQLVPLVAVKGEDAPGSVSEEEVSWEIAGAANEDEKALGEERAQRLKAKLVILSARERAAFELRIYGQMRLKEIAEVMGCRLGTVKVHLFRAVNKLKDAMGGEGA